MFKFKLCAVCVSFAHLLLRVFSKAYIDILKKSLKSCELISWSKNKNCSSHGHTHICPLPTFTLAPKWPPLSEW